MKIAYILYPEVIISNKSNGIRSQAKSWAEILQSLGHQVDFISSWGDYDWKSYDVIHFFGLRTNWLSVLIKKMKNINENIVLSPIVDPDVTQSFLKNRCKRFVGSLSCGFICTKLYQRQQEYKYVKKVLVRSKYEYDYLNIVLGIPSAKLFIVPLSYSKEYSDENIECERKENICLHISSIYQNRKNVVRLIEAAKKFNFELFLAGNKGTPEQFQRINNVIGGAPNVHVLGFVSAEEKLDLYKKAKVFALPSLNEGVGIVALDAAVLGCEVVITNIPGPKEYYDGNAIEVNPYSVDDIGNAVLAYLNDEVSFQPSLKKYLRKVYSPKKIGKDLEAIYSLEF